MDYSSDQIENKLHELFQEVDVYLEEKFGSAYPLHPARAERGETANNSQDGLFNIGVKFTIGYGSEYGKGYVVDVDTVTLKNISSEARKNIYDSAAEKIRELLPKYFPKRELKLVRDGNVYKIVGDFSLGEV